VNKPTKVKYIGLVTDRNTGSDVKICDDLIFLFDGGIIIKKDIRIYSDELPMKDTI
jgi:hypothetical protein